jgi:hypothetical protein
MKEINMIPISWFPRIKKNKFLIYKIEELEVFYLHPNFSLLNILFTNEINFKTGFREII